MKERWRIMFLCTGNSCRSQMAEGWARALHGETIDACSAGTNPQELNPRAVRAMAEVGIDISSHAGKPIEQCDPQSLDLVVTVCGDAREACPGFRGNARVIHRGFDDPPRLALDARTEEEAMKHYRRVRDEIRDFVASLPEELEPIMRDRFQGAQDDHDEQ